MKNSQLNFLCKLFMLLSWYGSLLSVPPIGLEWNQNCCSYSAVVQILYASREFRNFLIKNRDYITQNDQSGKSAALIAIFDLIEKAEIKKETFVSFGALEPYYKKLGFAAKSDDATVLITGIDSDFFSIRYRGSKIFRKGTYFSGIDGGKRMIDRMYDMGLKEIILPPYVLLYDPERKPGYESAKGFSIQERINFSQNFNRSDTVSLTPRGFYRLYGILRANVAHAYADILDNNQWYRCDGSDIKLLKRDIALSDEVTVHMLLYEYDPHPEDILNEFAQSLSNLSRFFLKGL